MNPRGRPLGREGRPARTPMLAEGESARGGWVDVGTILARSRGRGNRPRLLRGRLHPQVLKGNRRGLTSLRRAHDEPALQ